MTQSAPARQPRSALRLPVILAVVLGLVAAAALGWIWYDRQKPVGPDRESAEVLEKNLAAAGIDGRERAAIEGLIRAYILEHPEIIPEAVQALQARESAAQIGSMRGALETPFPGAVLGNPQGKVTLVEFTDFACTYCRKSAADVDALIAANPDLKVVIRELPIIAPESAPAARMALAAAAQGKYAAFHKAMFAGDRPTTAGIEAAARAAGMDLAAAKAFIAKPEVEAELARNLELARRLGINGTPAWLVGDELIAGAVGKERLQDVLNAARKSR